MPDNGWESLYDLSYSLHEYLGECLYSVGEVSEAESHFNICLDHGKTVFDKVRIYIKLSLVSNQIGAFENSFKYSKIAIQLLKYRFSFEPSLPNLIYRLLILKLKVKYSSTEKVNQLPEDNDETRTLFAHASSILVHAAYKTGKRFLLINGAISSMEYTFIYGISPFSVLAFSGLSLIYTAEKIADYRTALKSGRLAMHLLQKYPNSASIGYCRFLYANFAARWESPLKDTFSLFKSASRESLSQGNISIAMSSLYCLIQTELIAGVQLRDIIKDALIYGSEANKLSAFNEEKCLAVYRDAARSLKGEIKDPIKNIPIEFSEELKNLDELPIYPIHLGHYQLWRIVLCYLFGEYEEVKKIATLPLRIMENYGGLQSTPMLLLATSLSLAANIKSYKEDPDGWKLINRYHKIIVKMAEMIPINYAPYRFMIEGEMNRLKGDDEKAFESFQKAISVARQAENLFLLGISYELITRFYIKNQNKDLASHYINKSIYCFEVFEAQAKVDYIKTRYKEYFRSGGQFS